MYTAIFSGLALRIYAIMGWVGLVYIFWTKLVGFVALCAAYKYSRGHQLIFFHNLGLATSTLLVIAALSDLLLFTLLLTLFHIIV